MKKMPVYDYLWNNSDPILELAAKVVPSMVPMKNVGVLDMVSLVDSLTYILCLRHKLPFLCYQEIGLARPVGKTYFPFTNK